MNFSNIFSNGWKYALVNLLTLYRIAVCPVLLLLILFDSSNAMPFSFKWFVATSAHLPHYFLLLLSTAFFTDMLDGFLARAFKVTSEQGNRMDSIADDCLFITALISIIYFHPRIILENIIPITTLIVVYMLKLFFLWHRHKKLISGLHTHLAKFSAVMQAVFFLHALCYEPSDILFKVSYFITIIAIVEEIIIILNLPELKKNVKGIFFRSHINEQ